MQEPLFAEEPTYSVAELSSAIGSALGRAFPDEVWVRGEIADISRARGGHVYFDLCGESSRLRVTLWDSDRRVVNAVIKRAGGAVRITDGTEVRIRAQVHWWAEGGTVSLRMLSLDTAYTLGRMAEARELLVGRLRAEGLLARQQALRLPTVPLRVGLVTSDGSAAAADFLHTLEASGFGFSVVLVDARVQGLHAGASVCAALEALGGLDAAVDVVCVVRGGGARTDLVAFDGEAIARAIAACPVPVLTGIGHETDSTVADEVAHLRSKTPTACASVLVERVATARRSLVDRWATAERRSFAALDRADGRLARASGRAAGSARQQLRSEQSRLGRATAAMRGQAERALDGAQRRVDGAAARARALDPSLALARGWTVTRRADGRALRSAADVAGGDVLVTTFADGDVRSEAFGDG